MTPPTSPPVECRQCGRALRWEHVGGRRGERWLAICACGRPCAFVPARPGYEPEDPLAEALGDDAPPAEESPPWVRVFQLTSGRPWWLPWRHLARACPGCGQRVTFAVWTTPAPGRRAHSALCLACGQATSEHVYADDGLREAPVSGNDWNPACVAVARLRRAVFSNQWARYGLSADD